tara:strand:- start:4190 stop:4648 length:459 start_codon:yes stop_codon:yes gene_type:complete
MLEVCLDDENYIIDDREIARGGISYTFETLNEISSENPNSKLYLILGLDKLNSITEWKDFKKIFEICNIIVSLRHDVDSSNKNPAIHKSLKPLILSDSTIFHSHPYGRIYIEQTSVVNVSSTEIRRKLRNYNSISDLVDPKLEKWLLENKIY